MITIKKVSLFSALAFFCTYHAQADTSGGFIAGRMEQLDLFIPHGNDCNPQSEAYIPLPPSNDKGFCIEKTENATAQTWDEAVQTCLGRKKRLPEPSEYVIACKLSGSLGISGMTSQSRSGVSGDGEWAGNSPHPIFLNYSGVDVQRYSAYRMGVGHCAATLPTGKVAAWPYGERFRGVNLPGNGFRIISRIRTDMDIRCRPHSTYLTLRSPPNVQSSLSSGFSTTNTSSLLLVSPGTRLEAAEQNII